MVIKNIYIYELIKLLMIAMITVGKWGYWSNTA